MADDSIKKQMKMWLEECHQEFESLSTSLEKDLSDCVIELYTIADDVDTFHKRATIGNVVGSAVGIAGGITTIVGIALAPVTFGASLICSIVGISVATAGGVTGVSASIADAANTKKKCNIVIEKVKNINKNINSLEELSLHTEKNATNSKDADSVPLQYNTIDTHNDCVRMGGTGVFAAEELGKLTQSERKPTAATQSERIPAAATRSERIPTAETRSERKPTAETRSERKPTAETRSERKPTAETRSERKPTDETRSERKPTDETRSERKPADETWSERIPRAFTDTNSCNHRRVFAEVGRLAQLGSLTTAAARGVELAAQGARVASGVLAGLFVAVDAAFLVKGSVELHRGAKTKTAEEIRKTADELLGILNDLKKNNETVLYEIKFSLYLFE